mgnify:CR=1 FL=1
MKKTVTWVLIADGAQARVLEHGGPGKGLRQVEGLDWNDGQLQSQEIVTDRPGSKSGGGAHGGGLEPRTDPKEHRETEFVKTVAAMLDRQQQKGAFDRLVIAAAPVALGDLRKAISPAVQKLVVAELNKDLSNIPTDKLDSHFDGILAA